MKCILCAEEMEGDIETPEGVVAIHEECAANAIDAIYYALSLDCDACGISALDAEEFYVDVELCGECFAEFQIESDSVRVFVGYDPGGYYLEFDTFLEHERNAELLELLNEADGDG